MYLLHNGRRTKTCKEGREALEKDLDLGWNVSTTYATIQAIVPPVRIRRCFHGQVRRFCFQEVVLYQRDHAVLQDAMGSGYLDS